MTDEQQEIIDELRGDGYAVTVYTPEELGNADPSGCEDAMVQRGWHYIQQMDE